MDKRLVKNSCDTLKSLRKELRKKAEGSVIKKIDEAIIELETSQEVNTDEMDAVKLLVIISSVLEIVASISTLITNSR
jgi:hypothetical protein